jgi:hypothetical protein
MSKYKNINSSIIYYVLTITLDVSSIGIHTHLVALVIFYSIIRLSCLQPIVLSIILMNLTQGMSFAPKIIHNLRVLYGKAQSCGYLLAL